MSGTRPRVLETQTEVVIQRFLRHNEVLSLSLSLLVAEILLRRFEADTYLSSFMVRLNDKSKLQLL